MASDIAGLPGRVGTRSGFRAHVVPRPDLARAPVTRLEEPPLCLAQPSPQAPLAPLSLFQGPRYLPAGQQRLAHVLDACLA